MSKWDEIRAEVKRAEGMSVKVGILQSKGGDSEHEGGITMIELAAIHEFGSPAAGIPQRSFIRSTFQVNFVNELRELTAKLAKGIYQGNLTADKALGLLGQWGAAAVKRTIREKMTTGPEEQSLKPATIAAKGSSTPLYDHGRLINTINYEVEG